ncbi:ABC transporter permease [Methylophaga sp. OBS4]|uniref:ABC transporter permease n=1 Tax=Methylophaga sp. OBS4 TaxID=2991935 RepID=UPI00224FCF91|nr:ABC transporter permease [Methylophaga sp. OBS4]MCX4187318.1 ABC transporter permease [Methylophaga sp. OBS4]
MNYFADSLIAALALISSLDADIYQIVFTSVAISLTASALAAFLAVPAGVAMALNQFTGKRLLQHILNTLMAMPTVVIGLLLYGMFSRLGPLGDWGLLYTPAAMIIAQAILIFPIMMNLTITAVNAADPRLVPTLRSLGARMVPMTIQVIRTTRLAILAAIIIGFGRAIGEVGAAMMLGGNIEGYTRTMTTAIALETSKGEFELGLALGIILLLIAFILNFVLSMLNRPAS